MATRTVAEGTAARSGGRRLRRLSNLLIAVGVIVILYAGVILAWGDPVTWVWAHWQQRALTSQFHEGEKANIHIQLVGNRVILVVIFDSKSSLGLVRLRVRKASEELNHIFEALLKKVQEPGADSPFAEITDEDIDNLFND